MSNRIVFVFCLVSCFFFFKQKTAYEMRISDWSSDVCSSDLPASPRAVHATEYLYVLGRDELLVFDATLRVVAQIGGLGDVIDTTPEGGGLLLLRDNGQLARLAPATHGFETLPPLEPGAGYRRVFARTRRGRAALTACGETVLVDARNPLIAP